MNAHTEYIHKITHIKLYIYEIIICIHTILGVMIILKINLILSSELAVGTILENPESQPLSPSTSTLSLGWQLVQNHMFPSCNDLTSHILRRSGASGVT